MGDQTELVCNLEADLSSRIEPRSNVLVVLILINLVAELSAIQRCPKNSRVFADCRRDRETATRSATSHIEAERTNPAMNSNVIFTAACAKSVKRELAPIGRNVRLEHDALVRYVNGKPKHSTNRRAEHHCRRPYLVR